MPTVGSLKGAPSPDRAAKADSVELYRSKNLYFAGIGFILDVKKGPFWEHSPTLYDISGIKDGWAKINKVGQTLIWQSRMTDELSRAWSKCTMPKCSPNFL